MKNALVYDWLINIGGGEKTLSAIAEIFPAPIYTLIADKKRLQDTSFADCEIHTSLLQYLPFSKQFYRYYLPLFSRAVEQLDLSSYDCVLSVSHAVAKGALTYPHQLHLCYCFTPMRYAWDFTDDYTSTLGNAKKLCARLVLRSLRKWDIASLNRVDHFAAISHYIAERIKRIYGREAEVIYPPVDTERIALEENKENYFLTVSRMVPYKKMDLIVETFSQFQDKKLIVIGDGPEMQKVKNKAKKNIEILGYKPDAVVKQYLQKARGFIFAAEEDFGIAPVEAQAAGTPVIAFGKGGARETIIENETGIFFNEQTVKALGEALLHFDTVTWDPLKIRNNALRFNKERFQREFLNFINKGVSR